MSGKLDQSLDEIVSTRRVANRGRGRARRVGTRAAPVGGIQKNTRTAASKAAAVKVAAATPVSGNDQKIIVSNLVRTFKKLSRLRLIYSATRCQ